MPSTDLKIGAPMATIFVGSIAALYQYTFWKHFNVNILQYVSLTDMVKLTVWPVIGFALTMLVGLMLADVGLLGNDPPPAPEKLKNFGPFRKFVNMNGPILFLWASSNIGLASMFMRGEPVRWTLLGLQIGLVSHQVVFHKGTLSKQFFSSSLRYAIIGAATIIPFYTWGLAKTNAENIRKGVEYDAVTVTDDFRISASIESGQELRHLGNTGSYTLFLVGSGPRVVVAKNEETGPVTLMQVKRPVRR